MTGNVTQDNSVTKRVGTEGTRLIPSSAIGWGMLLATCPGLSLIQCHHLKKEEVMVMNMKGAYTCKGLDLEFGKSSICIT